MNTKGQLANIGFNGKLSLCSLKVPQELPCTLSDIHYHMPHYNIYFNTSNGCLVCVMYFIITCFAYHNLSRIVRKPDFCLGENKGADQLRGNREADQRLCFRYTDSTIPLLLKSEISSF